MREDCIRSGPSTPHGCPDETEIDGRPLVNVFLLSLPGVGGSRSEDVHAMFRQWIQSLGCTVHDILDPEMVII